MDNAALHKMLLIGQQLLIRKLRCGENVQGRLFIFLPS